MALDIVTEELIRQTEDFHGHMCPGLALGIRASEVALREMGAHSRDEEIVAVVETDMCGVDAIQFLTGCTFGKGNLIHKDYGKTAFSFYRRSDGKAIRIVASPRALGSPSPEREVLFEKMHLGTMTPEEKTRFGELQSQRTEEILGARLEELFETKPALWEIPRRARIHRAVICELCGESVMETRIRKAGDKLVCIPCSEKP